SDPSPRPSLTTHMPDSILEDTGGNQGGQSSSDRSLSGNEGIDQEAKEESQTCYYTPQSLDEECILEAKIGRKEILEEKLDAKGVYTEDSQDVERTRDVVNEEKDTADEKFSHMLLLTDPKLIPTGKKIVPLAQMKPKQFQEKKEKGVELKDVEENERPRPTLTRSLLTLKPLPKIDPKDKGKKKIKEEDESDTESEGIPEAEKKFKQLARDEEMARKVQEDWEAEEEVKKLAEEEAIKIALSNEYDFIQARIEADRLLSLRLQDEERERSSLWKREKNSFVIQLQLKEGFLQNKEPLQSGINLLQELTLYEKVKRFDESFTAVGSTEDERRIKEMNEGVKDPDHKSLKKRVVKETSKTEDTAKVPAKVDVTEQGTKKIKGGHMMMMIARKRKRPQPDVNSDDEHRKCLKIVTFEGTIDSEIMEKKSFISKLDKVSSPEGDYLVIHKANGNFRAFNYLLEVLHIFDRKALFHLYNLMMEQYSEITLEGIELILWGDLKIMMESSQEENNQSDFWDDQQDWKIVTWRLYEACEEYILELEDGTVVHIRYPLSQDLLQRMLDLGLEVERESTTALDLIRFIKQQIDDN
ncbi:hypothetical protein Tco_0635772, partial [Tanacetum coccineum]